MGRGCLRRYLGYLDDVWGLCVKRLEGCLEDVIILYPTSPNNFTNPANLTNPANPSNPANSNSSNCPSSPSSSTIPYSSSSLGVLAVLVVI